MLGLGVDSARPMMAGNISELWSGEKRLARKQLIVFQQLTFPAQRPTLPYTAISLIDSNIEREDEGYLLLARLGKEF